MYSFTKKRKMWFLLLFVAALLLLPQCIRLRKSDRAVRQYFADAPHKPTFQTYTLHGRTVHYASIGQDTLPMVVFVHGSPGSWDAFIGFFKDSTLYGKARLVSVDRPGFGKSDLGDTEPSLQEQAALLAPVLRTNRSARLPVLVGHSLGGPVVCRMAMDYPDLVGGLVLVAPSIDPGMEKYEWYRQVGGWGLVRKWLPVEFDVSNQEILPLKTELNRMMPLWKNIRVPVTVIQGDKDDLVPPANADFAKKMLPNAPVKVIMLPGVNHFIPWSHPEVIQKAIVDQLSVSH